MERFYECEEERRYYMGFAYFPSDAQIAAQDVAVQARAHYAEHGLQLIQGGQS